MLRHSVDYLTALAMLGTFPAQFDFAATNCAPSKALQAALLTAVNAGKRAFPRRSLCEHAERRCLPVAVGQGKGPLNEIVRSLGGILAVEQTAAGR